MSTNESFIKAYRHDVARPATPAPARVRPAAKPTVAASSWSPLHTTVEIAVAHFTPATTTVATTFEAVAAPPIRPAYRPTAVPPTPISHPSTPIPRPSTHIPHRPIAAVPPAPPAMPRMAAPLAVPLAVPLTVPRTAPPTMPTTTPTTTPIIGKRPLSSFQPAQPVRQPVRIAPVRPTVFTPETIISAFRWPGICRTLWEEYAIEYERVAEKLVETSSAGRPIIGVTAINIGDGSTTSLLCLAVALAARKMRVALVDGSFHDPQLAELLGAKVNTSWSTVLDRGLPVAEAMIRATEDHIDLLPLDGSHRLAGHEAANLVAGMQTAVTAGVLRSSYDIVLVDLGALLAPGAYATLSNLLRLMSIQSAIVVANPRTADADDAAVVGELLEEDGCELLGVIENRARPRIAQSTSL